MVKKSYIKLVLFIILFSFLLIINSFSLKLLNLFLLDFLLIFLLILFYFIFGFEKDKHRYIKDVVLELLIVLITFFIFYYLFGLLIGYAKNKNYFNFDSFVNILLPLIMFILLKEFLRYQLLMKSSENKGLIAFVFIFLIIIDNVIPFSCHNLVFNKELFLLIALTILPSITENILCSYLSFNFGYLASIFYLLIMKLFIYIIPILPNPNEYLYSLIFMLFPILVYFHIKRWRNKDRTNFIIDIKYNYKIKLIVLFPFLVVTFLLILVVSGYFRYYAIAVASGSMEPNIYKGDVVIVDKNINKYAKGDIIAYNYDGKIVVHRIYKIIDCKEGFFVYTKGDANNSYDKYKISENMIIGVVKVKIPVIGYPTVLLNERW